MVQMFFSRLGRPYPARKKESKKDGAWLFDSIDPIEVERGVANLPLEGLPPGVYHLFNAQRPEKSQDIHWDGRPDTCINCRRKSVSKHYVGRSYSTSEWEKLIIHIAQRLVGRDDVFVYQYLTPWNVFIGKVPLYSQERQRVGVAMWELREKYVKMAPFRRLLRKRENAILDRLWRPDGPMARRGWESVQVAVNVAKT